MITVLRWGTSRGRNVKAPALRGVSQTPTYSHAITIMCKIKEYITHSLNTTTVNCSPFPELTSLTGGRRFSGYGFWIQKVQLVSSELTSRAYER